MDKMDDNNLYSHIYKKGGINLLLGGILLG